MSDKMTIEEVWNKVEWEGGIIAALEWGITSDDIEDEKLAILWAELEQTNILTISDEIAKYLYEKVK